MNATVLATDTKHAIEGKSTRDKFLRKVLREDGWTMIARSRFTFMAALSALVLWVARTFRA